MAKGKKRSWSSTLEQKHQELVLKGRRRREKSRYRSRRGRPGLRIMGSRRNEIRYWVRRSVKLVGMTSLE